jgi:hypothetical protein
VECKQALIWTNVNPYAESIKKNPIFGNEKVARIPVEADTRKAESF